MPRKPKRSRFLPLRGEPIPWTSTIEEDAQEFWDYLMRRKENSRRYIVEECGWKILEKGEGLAVSLVRDIPGVRLADIPLYLSGVLKIPEGETVRTSEIYNSDTSTDSQLEFSKQGFELLSSFEKAAARGDLKAVARWAYLAGFVYGRSNVMFHESLAGAKKRGGKVEVPDEVYRDAIKAAGPGASKTEIIGALPVAEYEKLGRRAHYARIAQVLKRSAAKK